MTRVKICGITSYEDALAACEAGADALGFVFAPEAKARDRYIDPDAAQAIVAKLPPFVATVAVCVNEKPARLMEYLAFMDYVQLCGEETVDECRAVAARAIKVFHMSEQLNSKDMLAYPAAAYLLDAGGSGNHGGTGTMCDWDKARALASVDRPVVLAGGLTPENVAEAVRAVRPYAVDTSGGVESAPGKKDHERIRSFIRNARLSVS